MPENDLALLIDAARSAGEIAKIYWDKEPQVWEKDAGAGPVTEADLAVNDMLHDRLRAARPDYGWLSEETEDDGARLRHEHVFIVDPIDGTRSFIAGEKTWAHSLAIAHKGHVIAGVIYLPLRDKLYSAHYQGGAFLNDRNIQPSAQKDLASATVLAARSNFDAANWGGTPPPINRHFRPSLAYRMALVAEGRFDAMLTLRDTWEWDVAAGVLIAAEAGACVTDRLGAAPLFNNKTPKLAGIVAGAHDIHAGLLDRLARAWPSVP